MWDRERYHRACIPFVSAGLASLLLTLCCMAKPGRAAGVPIYSFTVVEDAEDGDTRGWEVFDNDPPGEIANVVDPDDPGNRVLELVVENHDTGFRYQLPEPCEVSIVQWQMRFSSYYVVYVDCRTSEGNWSMRYDPVNTRTDLAGSTWVALGGDTDEGSWVTIRRNLQRDLKASSPEAELLSVTGIKIRGRGYIDDVRLYDYRDEDCDLLPDDFEESRGLDRTDPDDATSELLGQVIELTDAAPGEAKEGGASDGEPGGEPRRESVRDRAKRYRVALSDQEREELQAYYEERLKRRLSQAPRPQLGKVYRVRMRTGGQVTGKLERFASGRISLRTQYGQLVLPIHRVSRRDTLALFPEEAARQVAMRDVQKRVDKLILAKVEAAEKAAASKEPTAASKEVDASAADRLFGAGSAAGASQATPFRTTRIGRARYDVRPAPTPEELKPVLQAFGAWLKGQHRRVGGRIAGKIYAKDSRGNAILYLVMDPQFLEQDYDLRHRMAVGIQQFWAFRCQGMGVGDLSAAHLVMVNAQGRIVGGSRPEDPSDIWVAE